MKTKKLRSIKTPQTQTKNLSAQAPLCDMNALGLRANTLDELLALPRILPQGLPIQRAKALLESYASMLLEWSMTHNLTGAKDSTTLHANIIDSALPLGVIRDFGLCFDVGSGSGFPALVLAILRPKSILILSEPRKKRVAFLYFIIQKLGLTNVAIYKERAQTYGLDSGATLANILAPNNFAKIDTHKADLITSRAALKSEQIFRATSHILAKKGYYLLYKGLESGLQAYQYLTQKASLQCCHSTKEDSTTTQSIQLYQQKMRVYLYCKG